MTIDEAKQILTIEKIIPEEIEEKEVKTPFNVRTSQIGAINRCVASCHVLSQHFVVVWLCDVEFEQKYLFSKYFALDVLVLFSLLFGST